ncbi:MAG TPA: adenylate/guanylate cyclase domain-containing protein, partial [Anaerolineales bacterium]|nr:adenylate/guanylate cyclase domain-containing protein [Anaerolineales bacterium]
MSPAGAEQVNNLEQAIAALEAQRQTLGDAVVDSALAPLREKLAEVQSQRLEQQRKLATILFTDVVGSTRFAQQLDPEEVVDLMDATLKRLAGPVEGHGGHVTRFQGDGFKAVFGLPVAHENDPEMAIRAGLGILETAQEIAKELERDRGIPSFQVRVGINTGLVAAGGQTEAEDTVMGEAVNLAARLESAAPPGALLISHNTYRHVRGVFNVEPGQPVEAKGFPEPIPIYLVHSAKPRAFRVQPRGVEGVETRMIGRQAELKILQDALVTAIEESEGQVVTVLGDAGVGKSRLLYEFQNWIELLPQRVRLYQGRARQETQNLPYALLRDLFASRFQIQDGDPSEVIREKFERGVGEALRTSAITLPAHRDQERQAAAWEAGAHLLGQLLGFDFSASPHLAGLREDPQALRNRALESLVDYFSSVCRLVPVSIFLEDIHWADDSSLDVINHLGRRVQNLPVLVAGLARPSLLERRPHWGEGQLYHQKVSLAPLSKRESRRLVAEILQKIEQVPLALRELVVSGAEGNPFYIEELIKMLVEQAVIVTGEQRWRVQPERLAQVDVPSTLTGVLQARLDSLPAGERAVLQQASVVGRVFWDRVVEHIHSQQSDEGEAISRTLTGLRDKEMVFRREESIFSEAREYIFKHEVLREVTYETVLKKLRRLYHGWVADWLIDHASEGGEEHSGLIADHLERAGRGEQAGVYLRRAGEAALASYANEEAARYFRRALDLNPPELDRPALLGGLAEALQRQGHLSEAVSAWREGIVLYQAQGDLECVAGFYTAIVRYLLPNWPVEAVQQSEMGLSAVEGLPDSSALGHLLHQFARAYMFLGQAERARELCRQALQIAERLGDLELQADALATVGVLYFNQPEEALQALRRAVELAEVTGSLYIAHRAHRNFGVASDRLLSDFRSSQPHYLRALEIARQRGSAEEEVLALENLVDSYIALGDLSAIEGKLREFERVQQEMPQPELMAGVHQKTGGQLARLRGQLEEAFEVFTGFLAEARREARVQDVYWIALYDYIPLVLDMYRYQGWRDWASAEGILEEVIVLADQSGGIVGAGEAEARLSAVCARRGRVEQAHQWLQRAQAQIPSNSLAIARSLLMIAEAELGIAERRWEDAILTSESLLEWYTRAGMRWDQAHTLLDLAEIYRMRSQTGDREQAL